jgi:hypothetical protein
MDAAFSRAMQEREQRQEQYVQFQFANDMDSINNGPASVRRVFYLADQLRVARAEFDRILKEGESSTDGGEFDEHAYEERVRDREDRLQELLIKYDDSISQQQQDFIIEYSSGTYDKLLETSPSVSAPDTASTPETSVAPTHTAGVSRDITPAAGESVVVETAVSEPEDADISLDATDTGNPSEQAEVVGPRLDELASEAPSATDTPEETDTPGEAAPLDGSEREDLEDKLRIDALIMDSDPDFYEKYMHARGEYVSAQAKARNGDLSLAANKVKGGKLWIQRLRNRFGSSEAQPEEGDEDYETLYGQAVVMSLDEYERLDPASDRAENEMLLNINEAKSLQYDISEMQIASDSEGRLSVSRKLAMFAGLGVAALAGGVSAALDGAGKGGSDHWPWMAFSGVVGAVSGGIGAAKAAKSNHTVAIVNREDEAESLVRDQNIDALEATQSITEEERKKSAKSIGKTAVLGAAGGAIIAVGTHWAMEYGGSSLLAKGIDTVRGWDPIAPDNGVQDTASADTFNPLDTDHNNIVDTNDMPDNNGDGAITYKDQETFDPLDTNEDGVVDSKDMPDTNSDGVIDKDDQTNPETYDPLDSNRDGVVDGKDMPDTNGNGVIDSGDDIPAETFDPLDTNRDGAVDTQDWPDTNDDGLIDRRDEVPAETFDPLDSNRDGDVDSKDMPDTNSDGVIDKDDQTTPETFDPLDTNEDGVVDGKDMPDNNEDGVIDSQDNQKEDNESPIEPVETEGLRITIEQDSSFTQELMQLYPELNGEQSYELYGYLSERFGADNIFTGDNIYLMPDGDWGLHPGEATMPSDIDTAARAWIEANAK